MAKPALNQDYFTASDIEEVIDRLMSIPIAGGIFSDKKVAATQALNVIRILKDRLSAGRSVLELIYTDEAIVPRPLARFMKDYLNGRYKQEEAEQMLDGLQADMRKNYFQRKILFDDTSKLPRSKVFDPTGDFIKEIKKTLEATVTEYDPKVDSKSKAEEIYKQACNNPTGELDFDALAGWLAEIIARKDYPTLVLSVGARDPTPQEFAGRYLTALHTAYEKLGTPNAQRNIDRETVLQERTQNEPYQRELQIYKENLGGLLII